MGPPGTASPGAFPIVLVNVLGCGWLPGGTLAIPRTEAGRGGAGVHGAIRGMGRDIAPRNPSVARQQDPRVGTEAFPRVDLKDAVMVLGDPPNDGEAQARPSRPLAPGGVLPEEPAADARNQLGRHALAAVLHAQTPSTRDHARPERDHRPTPYMPHRIRPQG